MLYDYHIHTEDSCDSKLKSDDLIAKAISLGYKEIAITEHLDLLPQELNVFGLLSLTKYHARILHMQNKYPAIRILFGIEVGDYHLVRPFAQPLLDAYKWDIILGSVHFLSDHTNVAIPLPHPLTFTQRQDYYEQNLHLVSSCDMDVLAHLGVYKRYYPSLLDESPFYPIIQEIFRMMINRSIALEINYSPLRKNYPSFIPEPDLLRLYQKEGGKKFTVGSDAHQLTHFNDFRHLIPLEYFTPFSPVR